LFQGIGCSVVLQKRLRKGPCSGDYHCFAKMR
jgi:hypothetical protein